MSEASAVLMGAAIIAIAALESWESETLAYRFPPVSLP